LKVKVGDWRLEIEGIRSRSVGVWG